MSQPPYHLTKRARTGRLCKGAWTALVASALLLLAYPAAAEPTDADKERARDLMRQGDAQWKAGNVPSALQSYQEAHTIANVTSTGLSVARAQVALGQLIEARKTAQAVTHLPAAEGEHELLTRARDEAKQLVEKLSERIPKLQIEVVGAPKDATVGVKVDDQEIPSVELSAPREVNPGKHRVVAETAGITPAVAEVTAAERETVPVRLELAPALAGASAAVPAPVPPSDAPARPEERGLSPLIFIGYGAAAAGVAVGTVTGILSSSKVSSAKDHCEGNQCKVDAQDDLDAAETLAWASNIGFGVAVLGAAVGTYGLLTGVGGSKPSAQSGPKPAKRSVASGVEVQPMLSAGWVGVRGRY